MFIYIYIINQTYFKIMYISYMLQVLTVEICLVLPHQGTRSPHWLPLVTLAKNDWTLDGWYTPAKLSKPNLLLMEEILHHLGYNKLCRKWDKLPINWCRISSTVCKFYVPLYITVFRAIRSDVATPKFFGKNHGKHLNKKNTCCFVSSCG